MSVTEVVTFTDGSPYLMPTGQLEVRQKRRNIFFRDFWLRYCFSAMTISFISVNRYIRKLFN